MSIIAKIEGNEDISLHIEGPVGINNHTIIALTSQEIRNWFKTNAQSPVQLERTKGGSFIIVYDGTKPGGYVLEDTVTVYPPFDFQSPKE